MTLILEPKNYNITPNTDVTKQINELFASVKGTVDEKILTLETGTYYLSSENAPAPTLYITNTIGDNEWRDGETPHLNTVGLYIDNVDNFTLDGNGSTFVINGQMTNVAAINCKNLELKNFTLTTEKPDMHELRVVNRGTFFIDFAICDGETTYVNEDKLYFVGKDYKSAFTENKITAWWNARIPSTDRNAVMRIRHPFANALSVKELSRGVFRARYIVAPKYTVGDVICIFENRRKYQGIFGDRCQNIKLNCITSHFNYGLATVFQDCADVTISGCRFEPKSTRLFSSVADFIQVSSCRGLARIENNYFEGAGDDCLNVHGIHFKVKAADGNKLTVCYCHKQTHGFVPFREGDKIRLIDPQSLLPLCENAIVSAELIDENTLVLATENPVSATYIGKVIENATACPDVEFVSNTLNRIITRGILITTSGKVNVENNKFKNCSMHSILISDDAKSWYESGFVTDVTIKNNYFGRCIGYTLFVKPENTSFNGYVHRNIKFIGNTIETGNGEGGYFVKASTDVEIHDNKIIGAVKPNKFINSEVITDQA